MDDRLTEMLSRYLDDDLTDTERADFDRLLKIDSALRSELDGARRLRQTIASIASSMEPPGELDQVMEPLRRSAPAPQRRIRPVYRWLGVAAAVVLGVTVTVEMVLRNPTPTTVKPTRTITASNDDREIFELAPLPTAVPDDNRPIGATDRLLEEQPPPPAAPEPSVLEVVGPLTEDDREALGSRDADQVAAIGGGNWAPVPRQKKARDKGSRGAALAEGSAAKDAAAKADSARAVPAPQESRIATVGKEHPEETVEPEEDGTRSAIVLVDGREVWRGRSFGCGAGIYKIRLKIHLGVVVIHTFTLAGDHLSTVCSPAGLNLATVEGVEDGWLDAELFIQ